MVFANLWTLEILFTCDRSDRVGIVASRATVKHVAWVRGNHVLIMFFEDFTEFFVVKRRWIKVTIYLVQHWNVAVAFFSYF